MGSFAHCLYKYSGKTPKLSSILPIPKYEGNLRSSKGGSGTAAKKSVRVQNVCAYSNMSNLERGVHRLRAFQNVTAISH